MHTRSSQTACAKLVIGTVCCTFKVYPEDSFGQLQKPHANATPVMPTLIVDLFMFAGSYSAHLCLGCRHSQCQLSASMRRTLKVDQGSVIRQGQKAIPVRIGCPPSQCHLVAQSGILLSPGGDIAARVYVSFPPGSA